MTAYSDTPTTSQFGQPLLWRRRPLTETEVSDLIDHWHSQPQTTTTDPLHVYLGWTREEYAHYVMTNEIPDVAAEVAAQNAEWEQLMDEAYAEEAARKQDLQATALLSRSYWLNPCEHDDNGLSWAAKRWYALKLFLCWCLDLAPDAKRHGDCYHRDGITASVYQSYHGGSSWSSDWMEVGRGVFRGWWWDDQHDSESSY